MTDEKLLKIEKLLNIIIEIINQQNNSPRTILMTQKELLECLNISPNTLKVWENKGLKRLELPIEGTRSVCLLST